MNVSSATISRHEHPVQHEQRHQPVRRVGLADRAALHLGIALIKWGRRPGALPEHERRANRLERALAREHRDARVAAHRELVQLNAAALRRMS